MPSDDGWHEGEQEEDKQENTSEEHKEKGQQEHEKDEQGPQRQRRQRKKPLEQPQQQEQASQITAEALTPAPSSPPPPLRPTRGRKKSKNPGVKFRGICTPTPLPEDGPQYTEEDYQEVIMQDLERGGFYDYIASRTEETCVPMPQPPVVETSYATLHREKIKKELEDLVLRKTYYHRVAPIRGAVQRMPKWKYDERDLHEAPSDRRVTHKELPEWVEEKKREREQDDIAARQEELDGSGYADSPEPTVRYSQACTNCLFQNKDCSGHRPKCNYCYHSSLTCSYPVDGMPLVPAHMYRILKYVDSGPNVWLRYIRQTPKWFAKQIRRLTVSKDETQDVGWKIGYTGMPIIDRNPAAGVDVLTKIEYRQKEPENEFYVTRTLYEKVSKHRRRDMKRGWFKLERANEEQWTVEAQVERKQPEEEDQEEEEEEDQEEEKAAPEEGPKAASEEGPKAASGEGLGAKARRTIARPSRKLTWMERILIDSSELSLTKADRIKRRGRRKNNTQPKYLTPQQTKKNRQYKMLLTLNQPRQERRMEYAIRNKIQRKDIGSRREVVYLKSHQSQNASISNWHVETFDLTVEGKEKSPEAEEPKEEKVVELPIGGKKVKGMVRPSNFVLRRYKGPSSSIMEEFSKFAEDFDEDKEIWNSHRVPEYKKRMANTFRPWIPGPDEIIEPSVCDLPTTPFLQAIHHYASYYYTHVNPSPDMFEAMDLTSHLALGMIIQELIADFATKINNEILPEDDDMDSDDDDDDDESNLSGYDSYEGEEMEADEGTVSEASVVLASTDEEDVQHAEEDDGSDDDMDSNRNQGIKRQHLSKDDDGDGDDTDSDHDLSVNQRHLSEDFDSDYTDNDRDQGVKRRRLSEGGDSDEEHDTKRQYFGGDAISGAVVSDSEDDSNVLSDSDIKKKELVDEFSGGVLTTLERTRLGRMFDRRGGDEEDDEEDEDEFEERGGNSQLVMDDMDSSEDENNIVEPSESESEEEEEED